LLELLQHDALGVFEIVLRDGLIVDDRHDAVDRDHACRWLRGLARRGDADRHENKGTHQTMGLDWHLCSILHSKFGEVVRRIGQVRLAARLVARLVTRDAALEDIDGVRAETSEPRQLELHEDRRASLLRGRGQALADDSDRPAAAIVLAAYAPL